MQLLRHCMGSCAWQLLYGNYSLTEMIFGEEESNKPEIKSKLKELKAPHIFTYLTAQEEAMFVQPILCGKLHAWENGHVTLPEGKCDLYVTQIKVGFDY